MMQNRKKILIVFGTRPEAIKMAPLVLEFINNPDFFITEICSTGQHREMLDQVLSIFNIKPDYDLDIMKSGQDLFDVTSKVLVGMKNVLEQSKPDIVFVHGDTATSTAAALAAFYKQIPVAHIEAGLRTNDIYSPWPEEINRQITGRLTTYHFAPTTLAKDNLIKENINQTNVIVTGNTVIDALYWIINKINSQESLKTQLEEIIYSYGYSFSDRKMILVTGHRRENFGQGFINVCKALKEIALINSQMDILYPVHLNPNVQKPVKEILSGINNIFLIEPLEYLPFVHLLSKCHFVITDSGGIQEEAPSLGKPVLVMRNTTERPEAVDAGTVKLVGTNKDLIIEEANKLINNTDYYNNMSKAHNPYGNGNACKTICTQLKKLLIK